MLKNSKPEPKKSGTDPALIKRPFKEEKGSKCAKEIFVTTFEIREKRQAEKGNTQRIILMIAFLVVKYFYRLFYVKYYFSGSKCFSLL